VEYSFEFTGVLWEAQATASWVFVTIPVEVADEIEAMDVPRPSFGSVKVRVQTGDTAWSTSLFPDTRVGSYVLPLKRSVREHERLAIGDAVDFKITVARA
jgi:Domain of unknown function (DUF1905)